MPTLKIVRKHQLGTDEAVKRAHELEPGLRTAYGLNVKWNGPHGRFKGKNVEGEIDVKNDRVTIDLTLGLLAAPFAGKIRQSLNSEMARVLDH